MAGTIKGTVGIGLPTISLALLSQGMPAKTAIALIVFPTMISNAWQLYRAGGALQTLARYWPFCLSLMILIWITTSLTAAISPQSLLLIVGIAIATFALTSLLVSPPALPPRFDRIGQIIAGTTAGIMGGLTGLWSPPMVTYLAARRVEREEFVQATGLMLFLGTLPLAAGFFAHGILSAPLAGTSVLLALPALIGFSIGEVIRKRLSAERFQKTLLAVLLVMGLNLAYRAIA